MSRVKIEVVLSMMSHLRYLCHSRRHQKSRSWTRSHSGCLLAAGKPAANYHTGLAAALLRFAGCLRPIAAALLDHRWYEPGSRDRWTYLRSTRSQHDPTPKPCNRPYFRVRASLELGLCQLFAIFQTISGLWLRRTRQRHSRYWGKRQRTKQSIGELRDRHYRSDCEGSADDLGDIDTGLDVASDQACIPFPCPCRVRLYEDSFLAGH